MTLDEFKKQITKELLSLDKEAEVIIKENELLSVGMKLFINDSLYGDYKKISYEDIEKNGEEIIGLVKADFSWMIERIYLPDFFKWLTDSMFNENCQDDAFCEVCLRKLEKLGYVEKINGYYQKKSHEVKI